MSNPSPTLPPTPTTIANLPAAGAITGAEFIPISQNGVTVRGLISSVVIPSLPSGEILVGNASGQAAPVTVTGDISLTNSGVMTINSGAVTTSKIALGAVQTGNIATGVTITNPIFVSPALGTPVSGVATNLTGTASGLTAGNVTTNANLSGAINSIGNTTSLGTFNSAALASALTDETGSGAAVFANNPSLIAPVLGAATATSLNFGQTSLSFYQEGTWTPSDGSGAGLVFSTAIGLYTRIGRMVWAQFDIVYPSTANAAHATIAGLPFNLGTNVVGGYAPCFHTVDVTLQGNSPNATASFYNTVGANTPNSTLSLAQIEGVFIYNV